MNLAEIQPDQLGVIDDETLRKAAAEYLSVSEEDRKQNQILYYAPASPKAQAIHDCTAKIVGIGGGNRSGKSETMLVEMVMCMTGVFPHSQRHLIDQKFRGPIQCRLMLESLTTTLDPVILPKLQWWKWSGSDAPGGQRGHWGWVPKQCLLDGAWEKSWSAKNRTLTLLCRDPYNTDKVLGQSTWDFMSKDQDASDLSGADRHIVGNDEPPTYAQWTENEARIMGVDGRMIIAMTWPDDPAINVDWLYDEVYEPGSNGTDPDIKWFELWTSDNKNLPQNAVTKQLNKWSKEMSDVRGFGKPIRFSNRIHPAFTDHTRTWCFRCDKSVIAVQLESPERDACSECGSEEVIDYNHVKEFDHSRSWPTVFLIDPHPRKNHFYLWCQIDPADDWWVVADGQCGGDCVDTKREADRVEMDMGLFVAQRLTDPNMALSPASSKRGITWRDEFNAAGLVLDLADDAAVGRTRVNTMLKPDSSTMRPRLHVHPRCKGLIHQISRYSWADYSKQLDRDQKQEPKDKHSDLPNLLKYLGNSEPSFRILRDGGQVIRRTGKRRGAY